MNVVPTDANGVVFSRSRGRRLNTTPLSPGASPGGFFPNGVNGLIR
ncbi:hypothetical protein [Deinococcus hopiensis]|nr:hypothetical protein [Deinococcus hopiensis]